MSDSETEIVENEVEDLDELEDLMEISVNHIAPSWTKCVLGQLVSYQFQLDGTILPCVSANLNLQDFVGLIQIHEGVPAQKEREWKINEIFQREINYKRINNDISYYLKSSNKTVYLPGITVVLHPLEPGIERKILEEFSDFEEEHQPPDPPKDGFLSKLYAKGMEKRKLVNGLEVTTAWEDLSIIRWDTTRVMAIAIDGQHRLKSIEKLIQDYKTAPIEVLSTKIPVNFVLPVPQFGYSGGKSPRDVSRDIFADVNQNPVTPSASRMVLLNDSDIVSLCTRKLVTEKIPAKYEGDRIPLQMIRWKGDKLPFTHPDWEFNSIMNLKKIVSTVLNLKGVKDGYDHEKVKEFIEDLRESMSEASFSAEISGTEKTLLEYYYHNFTEIVDGDRKVLRPFVESQIESSYLNVIVDKFVDNHSSYILPVLTEITPYANYLDYCTKKDLFDGTFGGYNSQPKSHQQQISEPKNWKENNIIPHEEKLKGLKKNSNGVNLAWYVIFQEALILNAKMIEFSQGGKHPILGNIDDYIQNMNDISDSFWTDQIVQDIDRYLWTYICTRPDNNNPATKGVNRKRIQAILLLWHQVMQKDKDAGGVKTIDELFTLFTDANIVADYPDAKDSVDTLISGFKGFQEFTNGASEEDSILKANNRLKKILQLPRDIKAAAEKAAAEKAAAEKAAAEEAIAEDAVTKATDSIE